MEERATKRIRLPREQRQARKCQIRDEILTTISNLVDNCSAATGPPHRIDVSIRFDNGGLSGANIDVISDRINI